MKRLRFSIEIGAPRATVWRKMLEQESYRDWTSEFTEGSYYEGSWEQGSKIGSCRPEAKGWWPRSPRAGHSSSSRSAISDSSRAASTTRRVSAARAWAPAYEIYTFVEKNGTTDVVVDLDTNAEFEKMFSDLWPKALRRLKGICERG